MSYGRWQLILKKRCNTIFTATLRKKHQMAEGHVSCMYSKFLSQAERDYSIFRYCTQKRSLAIGAGYVPTHRGVTRMTLLFGYTLLLKKCLQFNNIS